MGLKEKIKEVSYFLYFGFLKTWICIQILHGSGFPSGSVVKKLPAKQETWVWSLGQEDPLEKEVTTHSSILAWEIPRTEEPGRLQSMGLQKSETWFSD